MVFFFGMLSNNHAQKPQSDNNDFNTELDRLLSYSVPLMSVDELNKKLGSVKIFDTREQNEYTVSHLPGAEHVGFLAFKKKDFKTMDKDEPIVLYCSVGYRSEKIGEKLQKMGFTNVFNLYGSIFEWANKGYPIENSDKKEVQEVHTYNKKWSQWVTNPDVKKTW